jgi:hypothetical protein
MIDTDRGIGGNTLVGGMLDLEDARGLLSDRVHWGSGITIHSAFVGGGQEAGGGPMLHKDGDGCNDKER